MAEFNITASSSNNFNVSVDSQLQFSAVQEKFIVSQLSDLQDVNVPDLSSKGNHVLMYNSSMQKYELVPADQVITASASDSDIPDSFVDILKTDLDNEIDIDGGEF